MKLRTLRRLLALGSLSVLAVGVAPSLGSGAAGGTSLVATLPSLPKLISTLGLHAAPTGCDIVAAVGRVACDSELLVQRNNVPYTSAGPAGYSPTQLLNAYSLFNAAVLRGGTQTVGIVDAMDDPNVEADLALYRQQFGLPACTTANGCFRKVNESGQASNYPSADAGWSQEISLDVDMVSAICPLCHILLVEASSTADTDLGASENMAASLGATEISNSYGGAESGSALTDDAYYTHPGIAITAASGDTGYGVSYPASATTVTAVGGTTLNTAPVTAQNPRGWTEAAWSGAGAGCSAYETKPTWQSDAGCSMRTVADVAAEADPNTGVAVYDSYGGSAGNALLCSLLNTDCPVPSGWIVLGGTSVATPLVASVYALAGNATSLNAASSLYGDRGALYDVTTGSDGGGNPGILGLFSTPDCGSYLCDAGSGYDGPTGLGTPNGIGAF